VGRFESGGLLEAADEGSFGEMRTLGQGDHRVALSRLRKDEALDGQHRRIIMIEPWQESLQWPLVLPDPIAEHEARRCQHHTGAHRAID
ncbi:hypothetical protein, partial [Enterobacter hormaechei]|uniref:hypothetical protein n=1 Tax=Enterobacter hormaechei TaxID=158836 RepID=UPI00203E2A66